MYNVSLEALLGVLSDHAPAKVDALAKVKREVEFGLLTVGIKIHDLGEHLNPLIEALGGQFDSVANHYRHERSSVCLVLPPLGSARAAVMLLECINKAVGSRLFRNPEVQIQVCSPGKLVSLSTAILGISRYLGSDFFPAYTIDDFATTFAERPDHLTKKSHPFAYGRGKRMVIYDAGGTFDDEFPYWGLTETMRLNIESELPFSERTDLLDCKTSLDIANVNLVSTLLVHRVEGGYWGVLGEEFVEEMTALLQRHQLEQVLMAPWVCGPESPIEENGIFMEALREVVSSAFDDALRLAKGGSRETGILFETKELLSRYRSRLILKARSLKNKGGDT